MDLFLSHSSIDKEMARKLANDLKIRDIEVWFDEWKIKLGDSITQKVQQGLGNSKFLAVLLSSNSIQSGWVEKEWQSRIWVETKTKETVILPLLIEKCDIPLLLQDKKYIDLSVDYERAINEIVAIVNNTSVKPTNSRRAVKCNKSIAIIISIITAAAFTYISWSAYSVYLFINAGKNKDVEYINEHVEWEIVRESLSKDAEHMLTSVSAKALNSDKDGASFFGLLTYAAGPYLAKKAIEYWISPAGISYLITQEGKTENTQKTNQSSTIDKQTNKKDGNEPVDAAGKTVIKYSFSDFNGLKLHVYPENNHSDYLFFLFKFNNINEIKIDMYEEEKSSERVCFLFKLHNLRWMLVRIILPASMLNAEGLNF